MTHPGKKRKPDWHTDAGGVSGRFFLPVLVMFFGAMPASAYVGPGVGAGTIAVIVGIFGAIFLSLLAVIYYPIKRVLKRKRANKVDGKAESASRAEP